LTPNSFPILQQRTLKTRQSFSLRRVFYTFSEYTFLLYAYFFVHFHPIYPESIGYTPCASVGKIRIAASEAAAFVSALTRSF